MLKNTWRTRAPFRHRLLFYFRQGASEAIAGLGQTGVADDQIGCFTAHLLHHVAARSPKVANIGHVRLQRKRFDALSVDGSNQIKPIAVTAMEVHANHFRAVHGCRQTQGLANPAVAAGTGNQDTSSSKGFGKVVVEVKLLDIWGKGH